MINCDSGIIEECKKGGRRAQMHIYTTFYKRVYNTCYRILHNDMDAEDTMQEAFLKAFSAMETYQNSVPFEAWLVRIAVNASIDKFRKKNLQTVELYDNVNYEVADDDDNDWENILEQVGKVKAAIDRLPDTSRLIINLYLIEGYDHEEIAEILNIAPGTARIQYMRAKQKLITLI